MTFPSAQSEYDFAVSQGNTQYADYLKDIMGGFNSSGGSDPFSTGAPAISPSGSVSNWFGENSALNKGLEAILPDWFKDPVKALGSAAIGTANSAKGIYDVASFLTDFPRLVVVVIGILLIVGGFMAATGGKQTIIQMEKSK
jgi:hypothetical protein